MDSGLRKLERAAATDPDAKKQWVRLLQRAGNHPFWVRVREVVCPKDNIYHDEELKQEQPNLPRWEDRGPSNDRRWVFFLHIPIEDTEMVVWLGEMNCFEDRDGPYLIGEVHALQDRYLWDKWIQRTVEREGPNSVEVVRANWAVAAGLKREGGNQAAVHFRADLLPIDWTPASYVDFVHCAIQPTRADTPQVALPSRNFLVGDYLFNLFYEWLQNTQTEYGIRLRQACYPLDYQLPTIYQGRHIWLHYWKEWDGPREIIAEPGDYYPSRVAYDVSYCVSWCGDYSARFYRWGGEPGDDNSGSHINALSACEVVNMDKPKEDHLRGYQLAQERAFKAVQKKLQAMIAIAQFWRYDVILEEVSLPYPDARNRGCPHSPDDPYRSTWIAGMHVPPEVAADPKNRGWCNPI